MSRDPSLQNRSRREPRVVRTPVRAGRRSRPVAPSLPEVIPGALQGFDREGQPQVEFEWQSRSHRAAARSLIALDDTAVGSQVALVFEQGDVTRPVVIGRFQAPSSKTSLPERIQLAAGREVVLRTGKASITLHADGTVTLSGEYVISRAKGVNRIKGGSVQIN